MDLVVRKIVDVGKTKIIGMVPITFGHGKKKEKRLRKAYQKNKQKCAEKL
jgi:hypothetical protein